MMKNHPEEDLHDSGRLNSAINFMKFKKEKDDRGQTLSSAAPYKFNSTRLLAQRRASLVRRAFHPDARVAGTSLLVPSELCIAAGYYPFNWEMFASLLASNPSVVDLANAGSVTSPRCSFVNSLKGAYKHDILPLPDVTVGSSAYCEGIGYMIEELGEEMNVPHHHIDIPLYDDPTSVESMAQQLNQTYDELCAANNISGDEKLKNLRSTILASARARRTYLEIWEMREKYAPLNLGLEPLHWHFQFMPLWGDEVAVKICREMKEEIHQYINERPHEAFKKGIPVGMFGLIPYGKTNLWKMLEEENAYFSFEGVNYIGETPILTDEQIMNADARTLFLNMAETSINTPIRGGRLTQKSHKFMKTARDMGTEGMIIFSHEHCQMLCPRLSLLETISNRNEMDVVTVSGDCILGMPPGPANIRLGTFFSSLKGKKTDADEIIQTRNTDEEVMNTLGGVRLGVDFGSGYSKFVLLDPEQNVLDKGLLNSGIDYPSLLSEIQERIPEHSDYKVGVSGVGGDNPMFQDIAHSQTTEINALMNTVRNLFPAKKNFLVIDIGTQDVKILLFKNMQSVPWVNTNKSCGAGTGLVLAQILERWRQSKPEMTFQQLDQMASEVQNGEVINTTCGIFAVTSVVSALVQSDENRRKRILRGVYQYIATQALKLLPADFRAGGELFLTGGIASHQTLRDIFTSKGFHLVDLPDNLHPQFLVAYGTALSIG